MSQYLGQGTFLDASTRPRTPIDAPTIYVGQGTTIGPNGVVGTLPNSKPVQDACATGSPGSGQGRALGAANDSALGTGIDPKLSESFNYAKQKWEAENPGMKVYAFSGVAARPSNPGSVHPQGRAMDVAIYGTDGKMLNNLNNGDTPAFRAYESFAVAMGQGYQATQGANPAGDLRWGGNFGGTWYRDSMHFDVGGGPTSQGNVYTGTPNPHIPNNSDPSKGIKYDGPTDAATANAGQGRGEGAQNNNALEPTEHLAANNTTNGVCASDSNAGCEPISAGIPGIAASILGGAGMGVPSMISNALGGIMSGAGGLLQNGIMGAAQGALGSVMSMTQSGLPNVLTGLTSGVFANLQGMGANILPSITGMIPTDLMSSGAGGVQGLMTSVFSSTTANIIKPGQANLGGFPAVFSSALGSSSGSMNLQQALNGSISQVFGKAGNGILGTPTAIPGFDIAAITSGLAQTSEDEGIEGIGNVLEMNWKPNIDKAIGLTAPIKEVLPKLVKAKSVNGFSSLFKDYNSMITQGYGNLTDNLVALGTDLNGLGKVGDMKDLLNIGTARQLARQLTEAGIANQIGLSDKLNKAGLNVMTMNSEDAESTVYGILASITDGAHVELVRKTMSVVDTLPLTNVADLITAQKALPQSYRYNYFENIQDMAITLALAGNGIGTLKSLGELGTVMMGMETAESFTELLDEYTLVRLDESETLKASLPPSSMFNEDGPVLADFIGSAAGYIHQYTFPRMAELHESIFANALMTPYKDLAQVLADTLSGTYSGGGIVNPPNTAKYTIGSFANLDAAVNDIITKINTELTYVKDTAPGADPDFWKDLQEYETLHRASSEYLAHERRMRLAYGIDIGDPRRVTNYYGDGTTISFGLEGKARTNLIVVVNGEVKVQGVDYTYDEDDASITLTVAPTAGQVVSISYEINSNGGSNIVGDTWQLASSIESHALQTGYGGPADFLNRIATDDRHGQRIKAIMMQARNKVRLEAVGIACPGFNRVLNTDDNKDFNFIEKTGIWSSEPTRAGEIWIQRNEEVESIEEYILNRLQRNAAVIKPDNDKLLENVTRRLIFLSNNQLVITDALAAVYSNSVNGGIFAESRPDMAFTYDSNLPSEGYVLGDFREIMSAICRAEGFLDENFSLPLTPPTEAYLSKIGIDIALLTSVLQRTLLVSLSKNLGLLEEEATDIFGVQSISKTILKNVANHY